MKNEKKIQAKIDAYFDSRKSPLRAKDGALLTDEAGHVLYEVTRPLTVTGLCRALGFCSREEMMAVKDEKSAEAIASALLAVEEYAEEKLFYKESFAGTKLFLSVNFPRWRQGETEEADEFPEAYEIWAK
ncbi:MAG: hypothetical protein IKT43_04705 [Clostridia bacterium]|nr:hypothetical protein [Clostridia bacterium]